jgi:hypothetical protein
VVALVRGLCLGVDPSGAGALASGGGLQALLTRLSNSAGVDQNALEALFALLRHPTVVPQALDMQVSRSI